MQITKTRFSISPHLWFVLHTDKAGELVGLEEHDYREGGSLHEPDDGDWGALFLRSVRQRCSGESYKNEMAEKAATLLASLKGT